MRKFSYRALIVLCLSPLSPSIPPSLLVRAGVGLSSPLWGKSDVDNIGVCASPQDGEGLQDTLQWVVLGTNTVYLSKAINEGFRCNFHTLMNQYRVSYVIEEALNSGDSLEEIAKKYGFWSRSSFYGVFHDYTGMTPRRYTEEILKHRKQIKA